MKNYQKQYPIDKGIPLPFSSHANYNKLGKRTKSNKAPRTVQQSAGSPRRYPFDLMNIGDSFQSYKAESKHMSQQLRLAEDRTGYGFTTRLTNEGVRVWRAE